MRDIRIITHDGKFHADEVIGCALLKAYYFKYDEETNVDIIRISHCNNISEVYIELSKMNINEFNYVLDNGRKFDGMIYFDHHHEEITATSKATAGKILDYVMTEDSSFDTPELNKLCKMVDDNDVGRKMATFGDLPYFISLMQNPELGTSDEQFNMIVNLMTNYIYNVATANAKKSNYYNLIIENSRYIEDTDFLFYKGDKKDLLGFTRLVSANDFTSMTVDGVMMRDEEKGNYVAYTLTKDNSSYEKAGISFTDIENKFDVDFIHNAGFIMVDKNEFKLMTHLKEIYMESELRGNKK